MINDISIKLVTAYKNLGLDPGNISERKAFLAFLTLLAAQKMGYINMTSVFNKSHDRTRLNLVLSELTALCIEQKKGRLAKQTGVVKPETGVKILQELINIFDGFETENVEPSFFLTLYEFTLKRLQEPFAENREALNFDYQIIPDDISRLLDVIAPKCTRSFYDPLAKTGEIVTFLAAFRNTSSFTTESYVQSSDYFYHKFLLCNVSNALCLDSYALAETPGVSANSFDFSFTLYEPVSLGPAFRTSDHLAGQPLKGHFDPKRINDKIVPARYREFALIQHMLWATNSNGTVVVILGKGPLHRLAEEKAREQLLRINVVDSVILLPEKLISSRTVQLYALILKKNRSLNDVQFINASNYFEPAHKRNRLVGLDKLASMLHGRVAETIESTLVDVATIMTNNCILNPEGYLETQLPKFPHLDIDSLKTRLKSLQANTDLLLKEFVTE